MAAAMTIEAAALPGIFLWRIVIIWRDLDGRRLLKRQHFDPDRHFAISFYVTPTKIGDRFGFRGDIVWYLYRSPDDEIDLDKILANWTDPAFLRRTAAHQIAALAIVIAGRERAAEWQADQFTDPGNVRYSAGLVIAAAKIRGAQALAHLVKLLCWALRSDWRTWTPLTVLLAAAAIETARTAGPGAGIPLVATSTPTLALAVRQLRRRMEAVVRRMDQARQR
nr:hypothetical protein GCM10025732_30040 [Glycomyces mayteni]